MKNVMLMAEMAVCVYGDVVTENIHEHPLSQRAVRKQAFQPRVIAAFISTQVLDLDGGLYIIYPLIVRNVSD